MRDGMNDFIRSAHAADQDMPTDVRALEDAVGVRLVVADRTNPEDVGFVQWRVALYLAGDLNKKSLFRCPDFGLGQTAPSLGDPKLPAQTPFCMLVARF